MKKIISSKLISSLLSVFIIISSLGTAVSADESISVSGDSVGTVQDIIDSAGSNEEDLPQNLEESDIGVVEENTTKDESDVSVIEENNDDSQLDISEPVVIENDSDDSDRENTIDNESGDSLNPDTLHFEDEEKDVESTEGLDKDIANAEATDPQDEEILPVVVCGETHISAKDSPLLNPSLALSSNTSGYSKYTFTETDQALYNNLKSQISDVAYGRKSSSNLYVSFDDLGIGDGLTKDDLGLEYIYKVGSGFNSDIESALSNILPHSKEILYTLLVECPFELYWYDKTQGLSVSGYSYIARKVNGEYVLFLQGRNYTDGFIYSFLVANDYSSSDSYTVNSSKVTAAKQAENNAKAIVNKYASLSDMEKLTKYKEEICSLVSYNNNAASSGACYGDPWQMVYVFDQNSSTNVVCEGYAKAFKYLCDHTDFTSDEITCIIAYGNFQGSSGSGGHMWNIVSLGNGTNYLVDLTNCDTGTIGYSNLLFMRNATIVNSIDSYSFSCNGANITYIYDSEMRSILFRDSAIKITTTALVKAPTMTMKRIDSGIQLNWSSVSGASKYKLYKRTETTDWKAIKETTSLTFTDPISITDTTTYTYCVRGVRSDGSYTNALEDSASTQDLPSIPITIQPKDYTGAIGSTATFSIAAQGTGLSYQWQYYSGGTWKNFGSNNPTATLTVSNSHNGMQYRCIVKDSNGKSVTSNVATIQITNLPLSILTQPKNYTGTVGSRATFTVVAQGTGLSYQWQYYSGGTWKNFGSNNPTATLTVSNSHNGMQYRCIVKDSNGKSVTSNVATIQITNLPLSILTQPKNYTGTVGSRATFTVVAQGTGLSYQWQYYSGGAWKNFGTNKSTVSLTVSHSHNGMQYRCIVKDSSGKSVTSNVAIITIK